MPIGVRQLVRPPAAGPNRRVLPAGLIARMGIPGSDVYLEGLAPELLEVHPSGSR